MSTKKYNKGLLILTQSSLLISYLSLLTGISLGIGLLTTYMYANKSIVNQVFLKERCSKLQCAWLLLYLTGSSLLLYYTFHSQSLYYSLIFLNPTVDFKNFWDVLWIVGVTDFVLKFLFMGFKCFILLVPSFMMSFKSKFGSVILLAMGSRTVYLDGPLGHCWAFPTSFSSFWAFLDNGGTSDRFYGYFVHDHTMGWQRARGSALNQMIFVLSAMLNSRSLSCWSASTRFVKNASLYGLIEKKHVHSAELLFQTMLTSGRMELHLCACRFSKACQATCFSLLVLYSLLQMGV